MTLSFWRYAHLTLALFCSLFLIIAATTGVILAVDAVQENNPRYKVAHFEKITIEKSLIGLRKTYPEITNLSINHNQYVLLKGIDKEGNDVNSYVDPTNGKILGKPSPKSEFIQWTTALHRSLFLKETGRFMVGFISFLLAILAISGLALIINRQRSFRSVFSTIVKENFAQYYHIITGRISLIPILIIAISGAYLTLEKFNFFIKKNPLDQEIQTTSTPQKQNGSVFKTTLLTDVTKIEFPFSNDPEEYYIIQLKDKEIEVNQVTGEVLTEKKGTATAQLKELNLNLHTGRTSVVWAIILGLASINLLFFIYSGFAMTLQRRASRIKNKYKAKDSEIILLVGSENGSTLRFANAVQQQLIALGKKAYCTEMNAYADYPKAEHLLILTATHGLGDAPSNADKFIAQLNKTTQKQKIKTAVIGFGSKSYEEFCGFADEVNTALWQQKWNETLVPLHKINDKSTEEFVTWIEAWNAATTLPLATTPSLYNTLPTELKTFEVTSKTPTSTTEDTFLVSLKTPWRTNTQSGDLLAIYPANDGRERLYSIGKYQGQIQLIVKLHPHGLGSGYLNQLEVGSKIKARVISNPAFHFPKKAKKVALISNGTGIAPFLGMIQELTPKTETHMYCGFRTETKMVARYKKLTHEMLNQQQLKSFNLALSKVPDGCYVTHLVGRDAAFFKALLEDNGIIMICGSLAMQKDVEKVIETLLEESNTSVSDYKAKGQILTDCY